VKDLEALISMQAYIIRLLREQEETMAADWLEFGLDAMRQRLQMMRISHERRASEKIAA
jgi:hypothetical protein